VLLLAQRGHPGRSRVSVPRERKQARGRSGGLSEHMQRGHFGYPHRDACSQVETLSWPSVLTPADAGEVTR
jgi:hypothetical protein